MRAEPESQADAMPAIETLSTSANGEISHGTPTLVDMRLTASGMPCRAEISDLGTATSRVSVAPKYRMPESTPPQATANGMLRGGSWISSPMMEASSSPTSPKQMTPNDDSNPRSNGMPRSEAVMLTP